MHTELLQAWSHQRLVQYDVYVKPEITQAVSASKVLATMLIC